VAARKALRVKTVTSCGSARPPPDDDVDAAVVVVKARATA
jgi:hypothetical protein